MRPNWNQRSGRPPGECNDPVRSPQLVHSVESEGGM